MSERDFLIVLAQLLIGTGFSFLYMQHVRMVFESRTNIAQLTQLERESLLRREDALHYSFYKTLAEAPDFHSGYEQLKNYTDIEYPARVNVIRRFYVLPELIAGYFYHLAHQLHNSGYFPIFSCWRSNNINLACDIHSHSMQFYFEFVWLMGGITLLVIYMYGSLLSENIFGGIYGVVSYVMFHNFVAKIYQRPAARENFAFPLICLQMFCVSLCYKRINDIRKYKFRILTLLKLSLVTACAIMCWQFSSVVFTTQLLILMMLHNVSSLQNKLANLFTMDFALSHMLGIGLAYLFSQRNNQFLYTWQLSLSFSLFIVTMTREIKDTTIQVVAQQHNKQFSFRTLTLELLIASSFHTKLIDLLTTSGVTTPQDNTFTLYGELCAHWAMQINSNFITNLASCNPLYAPFEWTELWPLIKTLIVKPYCMYGVVMLGMFFRKWRKSHEPITTRTAVIERSKKYLLEDFLEENHISMQDMSQKQTEENLNKCYKLLEECRYDYELYKAKRAKLLKTKPTEHNDFMDNIKRLKAQITKNNEERRREQKQCVMSEKEENTSHNKQEGVGDNKETKKPSNYETETNGKTQMKSPKQKRKTKINDYDDAVDGGVGETNLLSLAYLYSFVQMAIFTFFGLAVKKLFFLSFTQGCVIAPTVCSKVWYRQHRNIFWSVTLVVFVFSMFDPGVMNVHEEYYPTRRSRKTDELENMMEWITSNTERHAVFAGPIEIIGTVHLITKRPIANHAHLEMNQISTRTEQVYSVYSRQQSNDIFNQYSQMKIQYLIISIEQCKETIANDCDILSIWDDIQPAYRKYPQFCSELVNKNITSFLKVYANADYIIVKMFSQTVQISLKHNKMPEMDM